MKKKIEQLREISETKEDAMQCGGTYSASNLRICLELLKELNGCKSHQKYEEVLSALLVIKDVWQSALMNHNANEMKFIEYNIETGFPIKSKSNRNL